MLSVTLTILRILVFLLIIKKLDKYLLNLSEIYVSGKSLKVRWTLKVTNNTIYMFKSTYFTAVHLWALENSTFISRASYPLHPSTHPLLWGYEKNKGRTQSCCFKPLVCKEVPHCRGNHRPVWVLHFSVFTALNASYTYLCMLQTHRRQPQVAPETTRPSQVHRSLSHLRQFSWLIIFGIIMLKHIWRLPSKGFRFHSH